MGMGGTGVNEWCLQSVNEERTCQQSAGIETASAKAAKLQKLQGKRERDIPWRDPLELHWKGNGKERGKQEEEKRCYSS